MLFDGAVAATVTTTLSNSDSAVAKTADDHADSAKTSASSDTRQSDATQDAGAEQQSHNSDVSQNSDPNASSDAVAIAATATPARLEVAFVDTSVDGYQSLIDGIKPGVEVVLIDGSSNGLQQIADWASTHSGYDAVHIFSHGVDGQINLGSFVLTDSAIHTADVQAALTTLGQALTADGDLLLYGCDVAAGTTGDAFIRDLATATGADVAASSDATGSSLLGGNWTLEKHSGEIETTALAVEGYQGLLTQVRLIDSDIVPASASDPWLATKNIGGYTFTFSAPQTGGFLSIDQVGGLQGLYAYDYNSVSGNGTVLTIKAPDGYTFDLSAFNLASETNLVDVEVTYANGSTGVMRLSGTAGRPTLWDYMEGAFDDITQAVFTSSEMTVLQNFDIIDIKPIGGVAQNTAPAIGNLNGDSLTYIEDSPAITLDVGGNATVTDGDSANFDGGKLTVSITANGTASEDVLSIRNDENGSGQIGFNGVGVTWGGTVIGMVTGGTAGNDLVVSLNSSATPEAVQALTRALTYSNSNMREPSTDTRSISITVSDGDGHTSTPATVEVAVIGHNDAPKNPGGGNWETITERGSEALLFLGVDIDTVEAGQLITEMAIGSVSNVYGDSESGVNTDTGNDGIYGAGDILHIDGSAIPLVEASGTTQNNGFSWSVTQSADGSYTLTLSKAEGVSPELASAILNEATYSYIGSDSTITYRAFSASLLKDNGGTANGGKDSDSASMIGLFDMALAPLAANSAPVIANLDGDSITYTEGQDAVALDAGADATITDGDSANFDGGALTVSITANGHGSEDVLTIRTGGEPGKQITAYGSIVNYSGLDIGFYTGGSNGNDLVVTLNSNATPEAVQALVRAIAYQNSNDLNPSTDIRTVTVSVSDGDGGTSNLATLQINVTDVNDAPLVYGSGHYQIYQQRGSELTLFDSVTIDPVEAGQTITELQLTIWNYWNDGNMNDALTIDGSVIPLTAGSGTTAISGLSWTISGGSSISILTLSKAQGLSGAAASALVSAITYSNTGSDAQYGFRQFELSSVKDSGGTANGGSDTMNWTGVSTWFDIMLDATVNSAPAIGGLDGDSVTYAEGAAPVVLDANGDATVTDGDSADFDGGSLTAAVTANGHSSEDVLSIRSGGEAGNVIGVSGSSVTYNGVEIGTVSGGSDGNDLVVAFNANATPEAVQALTRALTYQNSNDSDPSTDTRSISITVSDGDGGTSNTATLQVSVTGVNDAPVVAGSGGSYGYSERDSALTLFNGINIDPVEAGQAITDFVIRIWSYSSSANSSEVLHIDGSDLPLTNGSGVTADHGFRWSVSQTGGQSYLSLTKAEGISAEAATALVAGITYRNNNTESTGMREILFAAVWDNGGTDNGGVDYTSANITTWVNLAIQPEQNSAPTIGGLDGDSVTYTEGAAPVLLDAGSDATVTDGDSANFDGGSLTVSVTANGHGSEDVLSIRTGGEAGSVIGVNGSSVSYNGVEIGTVSGGSEGHDLVVAFNANATPEAVQALTRALTYQNSNNSDPSTDTRSISITVSDGDDGTSSTATLQVEVNGVNDAPLISLNNSLTWLNAGTPQAQLFSQVTIDPVEAGQTITQLTLTADLLIDGNHEVLSVDGTTITLGQSASGTTALNGLSWSLIVSGSSASLVLSSAGGISGAAASTLVEGIRYSNTSNTTSGDVNSGTLRQFTLIGVKDSGGTANGGIDTQNVWMNSLVIVQQGTPVAAPQVTSVTASSPDGYYKSGQTVVITVNYSADLTLDTTDGRPTLQLDVGGATRYATYSGQSAANQLQFEYLVQAGDNSADLEVSGNAALQLNGATLQSAAGTAADLTLPEAGTQNSLSGQSAIVVDTVLPGATISINNPLLGMGQYATVTITFTEAVTGLTRDDITVENGTLGTLFTSDGGVTWQASLEPTTGITAAGNQIILNNAGVSDRAGNAGEGSTSISYDIDGVRPTVGIALDNSTLKAGASTAVTITFSEAVSGFSRDNLNPTSGTLGEFTSVDGGITWTGILTAESDNDGADNKIFFDNSGIRDRAGNTLQGLTVSDPYTVDTQLPTATIELSDTALRAGETSTVTITFSEAVSGLTREALTAPNGTLSELITTDGGITWKGTYTPNADVTDATNLIVLNQTYVHDAAGNTGQGLVESDNFAIDTKLPTATIELSDTALRAGETSSVTITFSEAVSGLTREALTAPNGTLSELISTDGGITWTGTYTPNADVTDATNQIVLNQTWVRDAAGNIGQGLVESDNFAIDTQLPTATIQLSDTALRAGETSTVTITFSEAVSGLTREALTAPNGTLSELITTDGGITWTGTYTPNADVTDATNQLVLNQTWVRDAAGNIGQGLVESDNFAIDTQLPTATIELSDTALRAGETSVVTITFSEAVSGLTREALSAPNGTLSELITTDGGITWTGTYTPNADVTDATNLIVLNQSYVRDAAGNIGQGLVESDNFAIDTKLPTATIQLSDTALRAGETSVVTITFSEAVSGLTREALSAPNGTLSELISADGGITWTGTYTPNADVTDATNLIVLNQSYVRDAAGNIGQGLVESDNFAIDTKLPTATIQLSDTALRAGETSVVTITFSEAVSGLTREAFAAPNGTLSELITTDGGITWTGTYTPNADVTDATNLIVLNQSYVRDAAGNIGQGLVESDNFAIDTKLPTATIQLSDTALRAGETSVVTIAFSEAVSGLTREAFAAPNGTLSELITTDGGITWTGTYTPNADVTDATNQLVLNQTWVRDAAGNIGQGLVESDNFAIDTQLPTATIQLSDTALKAGEASTVTITFSEAVSGLTREALTAPNGTLSELITTDGGITWTGTYTPNADVTDATNQLVLNQTWVRDAAGNIGQGLVSSDNFAIDTKLPTATIQLSDTALKAGETSTVTITFSEAVSGLTREALTAPNGTLSELISTDGGITWKGTYTPAADVTDATNQLVLNQTWVRDAAGNIGQGLVSSDNFAIDTQLPTATIQLSDTALKAGEASTVTITFSEAVSGLTREALTAPNGTLSELISTDGGITWKGTYTPAADVTDATNQLVLNQTWVRDAAGNIGQGLVSSDNFAIDTQLPTATIQLSDTALRAGETSVVTITFSEAVSGLTREALTAPNGTLSELITTDGGITWTGTYTPNADVTDATNQIVLNQTWVRDAAGNIGQGLVESDNFAIDTQLPTATIQLSDTALKAGEASTVTITFSEAVSGLTREALTAPNGTLSELITTDGGITWTGTYTPNADVTDATNQLVLNQTWVSDAAGNIGQGLVESDNFAIDTKLPTATIQLSDTALKAGDTSTVTITFSEAVSGLTREALTAPNGTLSDLISTDGGITWKGTYTPAVDVTDATNVIVLNQTWVRDAAGNTGQGLVESDNFAIDTKLPTATIQLSDTALRAGETSVVTITFSEAVSGLTREALTAPNGTLSELITTDGGITWTGTYTPNADVTDATNQLVLNQTWVRDAAGNTGQGLVSSDNFAIDTQLPTATIELSDTALKAGEASTVTITFSEAVSGLTREALTAPNGTLSELITTDGGITWTGTYTPNADVTDATNQLVLDQTWVRDAAGNIGQGLVSSDNFAIDTQLPTATIQLSDTALRAGETFTVTITFSEAVSGLTREALTAPNGTLSDLITTDGGITWTGTYTPNADVTDATNQIVLNQTWVRDAAGNIGQGLVESDNFAIDTQLPTATIQLSDTALKTGEASTVTITFSEAVSGLTREALTAPNGTLSELISTDGGITWKGTYTPAADVTDATNQLVLNQTWVRDAAGNIGQGLVSSDNFAIDTQLPTATIQLSDTALKAGETSTVTITFSEAVSGLTREALTAPNGTLSELITTDGGITWTGTYTPNADVTDATNQLVLNQTWVRDAAGNTGQGLVSSGNFAIDTKHPQPVSLTLNAGGEAQTLSYQLEMSEGVSGLSVADFSLLTTGSLNATLTSVTAIDATHWQIQLTNVTGNGTLQLRYNASASLATDAAGNGVGSDISNASYSNSTPQTRGLNDALATQQQPFSLTLPAGAFSDADSADALSYSATLADGSALPGWLSFDPATRTLSGTPTLAGSITVRITATDHFGESVSSSFTLRTADFLNGDPQFRSEQRHSAVDSGQNASYSREQLTLLGLAQGDGSPQESDSLFTPQGTPAGDAPSITAAFSSGQQGGDGSGSSTLAGVFSQNGVNHYQPVDGRSHGSDVNGDMSGRSSLAAQFAIPSLPGATGLEVFSGSSWQQVSDNTINQTVQPTSVFGTPLFSQQLSQPEAERTEQIAALESALRDITPQA